MSSTGSCSSSSPAAQQAAQHAQLQQTQNNAKQDNKPKNLIGEPGATTSHAVNTSGPRGRTVNVTT